MPELQLQLIRHPEPEVGPGVCYGQLDLPLKPGWERACDSLLGEIVRPRRILTSPLRRCLEPARYLGEHLDCPVTEEPGLRELSFGDWEGRLWEEFDGAESRAWAADYVHRHPPGGESFLELSERVHAALRSEAKTGGSLLVMTHAGPIRALLAHFHDQPLTRAMDFELPYLSVTRIRL